jgi:hypothetical protein
LMNMTSKMMDSMMTMPGMDMMAMNEMIEACAACEQACTMCSNASMASGDMAKCAAMCMDCAEMCNTMMRATMRPAGYDMTAMMAMMEACVAMCMACADECKMHDDDQCKMCAEACMQCVTACKKMMEIDRVHRDRVTLSQDSCRASVVPQGDRQAVIDGCDRDASVEGYVGDECIPPLRWR